MEHPKFEGYRFVGDKRTQLVYDLDSWDDAGVIETLCRVRGIGPWTANIYLLTVLRRPDIWPSEDLALAAAVQKLKRLTTRPTLAHTLKAWPPHNNHSYRPNLRPRREH